MVTNYSKWFQLRRFLLKTGDQLNNNPFANQILGGYQSKLAASGYGSKLTFHLIFNHSE